MPLNQGKIEFTGASGRQCHTFMTDLEGNVKGDFGGSIISETIEKIISALFSVVHASLNTLLKL